LLKIKTMNTYNYQPTITGKVIKTEEEQFDTFFYQGHPLFLIPDFNEYPEDIWLSYMEYLENKNSNEIYDQDGGEVHSVEILDKTTGLTKCTYTTYGISFDEDEEPQDIDVEIEGYIVQDELAYVFMATKVIDNYKI